MRANRVKELWKNSEAAIGGWLTIPSGVSSEIMAHQGWDALTIDMQHGLVDASEMMLRRWCQCSLRFRQPM